jgi:hypothetical protein
MSHVPYLTGFTTELEATPQGRAKAGDQIHFRVSGVTAFGRSWTRGEAHVLTRAGIGNTINRHGESWLDRELLRDDGKVALGPWPDGEPKLLRGTPEHAEAREQARREAHARPLSERSAALRAVKETYGDSMPTSSTINAAPDPTIRAAAEQDARLRERALRESRGA